MAVAGPEDAAPDVSLDADPASAGCFPGPVDGDNSTLED